MGTRYSSVLAGFLAVGLVASFSRSAAAADQEQAAVELERAWSLNGAWSGVAVDHLQGVIYALGRGGNAVELDPAGKIRREFAMTGATGELRLADFGGERGRTLLAFRVWAHELLAFDLQGKLLWQYVVDMGIDDVWATDSRNGKPGEVIIGGNGNFGVHVLNSQGQLRWKSTAIGNVWHVCAGDVWGEGTPQVVTTSARGQVHVFGGEGQERKDIDAGCYANMVRVGKLSEHDKAPTIFVAGSELVAAGNPQTEVVIALSGDGARKWSLKLPAGKTPHADSAALAPGAPWLAVGMRDGLVHVIDAENGRVIATTKDQGLTPQVGWIARKPAGMPLLLVATGGKLNAFEVPGSKK